MRRRRNPVEAEDFQMTPMIDMVFLLLVFFMCVSSLAQADKRIPIELPEAWESQVAENRVGRLTVTLDAAGNAYLGPVAVPLEKLAGLIKEEAARDPAITLEIRAERETSFARIQRVLKAGAEGGAYSIVYATFQGTGS